MFDCLFFFKIIISIFRLVRCLLLQQFNISICYCVARVVRSLMCIEYYYFSKSNINYKITTETTERLTAEDMRRLIDAPNDVVDRLYSRIADYAASLHDARDDDDDDDDDDDNDDDSDKRDDAELRRADKRLSTKIVSATAESQVRTIARRESTLF